MSDKKERFNALLYDLRWQYPSHPATFSSCCRCKVNGGRGGGHCAECIELDIAEITTPSLAHALHCAIKDQAKEIHNIIEYLNDKEQV